MRKIQITQVEGSAIYNVLNQPSNPQAGLSVAEVRKINPILDKIEKHLTEKEEDGKSFVSFDHAFELILKESEYILLKDRLINFNGWANAAFVRKVVSPLVEKFEEAEKLAEDVEQK